MFFASRLCRVQKFGMLFCGRVKKRIEHSGLYLVRFKILTEFFRDPNPPKYVSVNVLGASGQNSTISEEFRKVNREQSSRKLGFVENIVAVGCCLKCSSF